MYNVLLQYTWYDIPIHKLLRVELLGERIAQ